jgi:hypothetical protein
MCLVLQDQDATGRASRNAQAMPRHNRRSRASEIQRSKKSANILICYTNPWIDTCTILSVVDTNLTYIQDRQPPLCGLKASAQSIVCPPLHASPSILDAAQAPSTTCSRSVEHFTKIVNLTKLLKGPRHCLKLTKTLSICSFAILGIRRLRKWKWRDRT